MIARCQNYQAALDAPGTSADLVPTVNYDPLTGSQEALPPNVVVSVLQRAPRLAQLRVRATYPDGQQWGDIPVQVVRLDGGQGRVGNVGRLREDCGWARIISDTHSHLRYTTRIAMPVRVVRERRETAWPLILP